MGFGHVAVIEEERVDGVFGVFEEAEGGVGVDTPTLSELVVEVTSSSSTSGLPKSQRTPCLEQLPHLGWTSSHLIFLFLHLRHPARDFLWERRGGMAAERFGGFHVSSTSSRGIH